MSYGGDSQLEGIDEDQLEINVTNADRQSSVETKNTYPHCPNTPS
jgi:hypothetical protein